MNNNSSKTSLIVLALVVLIALGSLVLKFGVGPKATTSNSNFSSENVNLQNVDLASKEGEDKLPAGFPTSIPVELANINSSQTLNYPDKKVTLYNVGYFSLKQQEEVWTLYNNFFKADKYTVTRADKSAALMVFVANKENTEITVTLTPQTGRVLVLVSVVVRQ